MINLKKVAIVQLCHSDYEALEISLAALTKFTNPNVQIFLLQNGRGTYDTERTYRVCKRYETLFPKNVITIDWITPNFPRKAIRRLLKSRYFNDIDYVCKIDDDVFPLTPNWIEKLIDCYQKSENTYKDKLGYITTLINNNPWGFKETVNAMHIYEDFMNIAREHYIGIKNFSSDSAPYRFVKAGEIHQGGGGSVWALPIYARFIHKHTTMQPNLFVEKTKNLSNKEVNNLERYSINCMFFKKDFWNNVCEAVNDNDDEFCVFKFCKDKKIIAVQSIPMVHLNFYTQREENKDLLPIIRNIYQDYLALPFQISMCPNKQYEIENRLRAIEQKIDKIIAKSSRKKQFITFKYWIYTIFEYVTFGKLKNKITIQKEKYAFKKHFL